MYGRKESKSTILVSFSGIDGAGKSTQIQALYTSLRERRLDVIVLTFWDNVAAFRAIREAAVHTLLGSEKGVGTSSAPVNRRDKNVRSWPLTLVRLCMYFVDAIVLCIVANEAMHLDADVVIFDRYIYDELANLNLQSKFMQAYVKLIMKLAPKPHISFLLDADPAQARARKPEYPLEFLQTHRLSYLTLNEIAGTMTIIYPTSIGAVEEDVLSHAMGALTIARSANPQQNGSSYTHSAAS